MAKKQFTGTAAAAMETTGTVEAVNLDQTEKKIRKTAPRQKQGQHVNVILSDEAMDYLRAASKITGKSYSDIVEQWTLQSMEKNPDLVSYANKIKFNL